MTIAATPGSRRLFVGPNDLSISLGFGLASRSHDPQSVDTARHEGDRRGGARKRLVPGALAATPKLRAQFAGLGYQFIAAATDVGLLAAGAKALQSSLRFDRAPALRQNPA